MLNFTERKRKTRYERKNVEFQWVGVKDRLWTQKCWISMSGSERHAMNAKMLNFNEREIKTRYSERQAMNAKMLNFNEWEWKTGYERKNVEFQWAGDKDTLWTQKCWISMSGSERHAMNTKMLNFTEREWKTHYEHKNVEFHRVGVKDTLWAQHWRNGEGGLVARELSGVLI